MKVSLFVLVTIIALNANAQSLKVVDINNRQAVQGCLIYSKNPSYSVYTDENGKADLSSFKNIDSIFFNHINYEQVALSFNQLKVMKFRVEMQRAHVYLKEIEISSQKWEENKLKTPNRIETIKMKDVSFQNPQTAADLLGISGYAFIQKSQLGGGSPMLRGFATNRVLLVVDGVRMNTAIFRAGNLQNVISLDANAMESTEIVFGPVSVMYGSDAIGGVMDFQTLKPKLADSSESKVDVTGNALMRTSTANSEKTGHLDFNIGFKKFASTTSISRSDYGDLRSGSVGGDDYFYRPHYVQIIDDKDYMVANEDSTLQVGSKYHQTNFMQKLRYKPSKNWDLEYGFHFSETSPYNRYDRMYVMQTSGPYKNKLRWAEWYYGPQKWSMNRLGVSYTKGNSLFDKLEAVAAYQFFEESRCDREFMVRELRMQKEQVNAYSLNLDFDKSINKKLSASYGIEAVYNKINSEAAFTHVVTGAVEPTVTRYPDGSRWMSYGAYFNLNYKLNDKLDFNAGARYSFYQINADFDNRFFPFPFTSTIMKNDALNGSIGMIYSPREDWQLYANVASGFRVPNIDDMGKVFESTPGYLVVPNPELKPEEVYNFELGMVKTFNGFMKLDFATYYTLLFDGMVRKNFVFNGDTTIRYHGNKSRIQAVQNVTKIQVYGIQAGIEFIYKGFGLKSNISYQNGREQSPDSLVYYPLRHAAPTFGTTHLTYEHRRFKLDFYAVYNAKMDYEDLALTERLNASYATDDRGLPYVASWTTLNFKVSVNLKQYAILSAGIENITDRLYRPYSSGINAPGRNLIFSLRTKF